jgi:hypothetical protein
MNKRYLCIAAVGFLLNSLVAQPIITQEPRDRLAPEGAPVGFSVAAQGSTPLHYQWQFNGGDIPNAITRSLSFVATVSRAGSYSVLVRDNYGNASSSLPAQLQVQKRPVILQQPRNQIIGEGGTAVFEVRMNESGPYTYLNWWHHSTAEPRHAIPLSAVPTAQDLRMEVPNSHANGTYNGLYWLLASNSVGSTVSRRASLNVVGPPQLAGEPQDRTAHRGGTAIFSISIVPDAAGPKTKQWFKDGEPISGRVGRMLILYNVQPEHQGAYYCEVSSIGGTTRSFAAQLTVY